MIRVCTISDMDSLLLSVSLLLSFRSLGVSGHEQFLPSGGTAGTHGAKRKHADQTHKPTRSQAHASGPNDAQWYAFITDIRILPFCSVYTHTLVHVWVNTLRVFLSVSHSCYSYSPVYGNGHESGRPDISTATGSA